MHRCYTVASERSLVNISEREAFPELWVFRSFGESARLLETREVLTWNDRVLMKNQSIALLHEESDGDGSVILALAPRRIVRGVDRATRC